MVDQIAAVIGEAARPSPILVPAWITGTSTPTLIYGDSGTGKTNLLATFAEYVREKSKALFGEPRALRLATADQGGFGAKVEALQRLGVIHVWRMRGYPEPFAACEKASRGFWPNLLDLRTGLAPSQAILLPPVFTEFVLRCPNGHEVRRAYALNRLVNTHCPVCKTLATVSAGVVEKTEIPNPDMLKAGGLACEGLTSWCDWIMENMSQKVARSELDGGEKSALGGVIVSEDLAFTGNNRAQVGHAQLRAQLWLANAATIPGLVAPVVFTALEDKAKDESGAATFGPKIAGSARTYQVPSWVGNCLRTAIHTRLDGAQEWRLYLKTYIDELNVPHPAKTRSDPDALPEYLADYEEAGNVDLPRFSRFSLKYFFEQVDSLVDDEVQKAQEKMPEITLGTIATDFVSAVPAELMAAWKGGTSVGKTGVGGKVSTPTTAATTAGVSPTGAPVRPGVRKVVDRRKETKALTDAFTAGVGAVADALAAVDTAVDRRQAVVEAVHATMKETLEQHNTAELKQAVEQAGLAPEVPAGEPTQPTLPEAWAPFVNTGSGFVPQVPAEATTSPIEAVATPTAPRPVPQRPVPPVPPQPVPPRPVPPPAARPLPGGATPGPRAVSRVIRRPPPKVG